MKLPIYIAIACFAAAVTIGCRETRTETQSANQTYQDTTSGAVNPTDGNHPGISAEDPERPSSSGTNSTPATDGSTANGAGNGTSANTRSDHSADGSGGRTATTAVNKAKAVQVRNRTNAEAKKSGYSAPDGTAAENHDGDMYTKHDTTRMPSGATPIK